MNATSGLEAGPADHQLDPEATLAGAPAVAPARLLLAWGAHEREVTEQRPLLTLGRGETCNIVIRDEKVSRLHALIKYSPLGFMLTDQSSNGTLITGTKGDKCVVRNQTHMLEGSGTLALGVHTIRYAVSS